MGIHFYFILDFHAKRRKFIYAPPHLPDVGVGCRLLAATHRLLKQHTFGSILSMSGSVFSCYLWTDVNHPRQSFFSGPGIWKSLPGGRNSWQFCVRVIVSSHVPPTFHLLIIDTVRSVSVPRMLNHFRALFVHNLDASHSEESNFPRLPRKRSFPS